MFVCVARSSRCVGSRHPILHEHPSDEVCLHSPVCRWCDVVATRPQLIITIPEFVCNVLPAKALHSKLCGAQWYINDRQSKKQTEPKEATVRLQAASQDPYSGE